MRTDYDPSANAMGRGAAVNLLGTIVTTGVGFLFSLVATHAVSARDIGLLALATTIVALATVPALFGLDTAALRFVALGASTGDERAARGAAQVVLTMSCSSSLALAGLIWWKAPWLAGDVFHKPASTDLLRIVALSLPGIALLRVLIAAIQALGIMTYSAWLTPIRVVANLVTALPLLALGFGVEGLAVAAVISAYAGCAMGVVFLLRVHPMVLIPAPQAWPVGRMLRFSAPQTLTATLFFFILWTDTLLLARFRTAAEVGVYAIVGRLLGPATMASTAVGQMFAPRIVAKEARGDRAALATMLKRVTYWNTTVSLPLYAALIVLAAPLLSLFGERYTDGASALAILAAGQLFNTAMGPLGQVINLSGRPYLTMTNNAVVAVLNIGACLVLIPHFGIAGAALSTAGALTLVNLIKLVQVHVLFGMHPFRADSQRTVVAGTLAAAATILLARIPSWPGAPSQVVVCSAFLVLAYGWLLWSLGLSEEDIHMFTTVKGRVARAARL